MSGALFIAIFRLEKLNGINAARWNCIYVLQCVFWAKRKARELIPGPYLFYFLEITK